MATAEIRYDGDLRCSCVHIQSGTQIETDAPTDNRGKGQRFSPTDTLCVSLATCIITTMGIRAMDMGIELKGTRIDVQKHMLAEPRRVGKIDIHLYLPAGISPENQQILERVGNACPVARSLHPDLITDIRYSWG